MTDLVKIRAVCADVLDEVASAEQAYNEALEIAKQQGQNTQQRAVIQDDQIEHFLLSARSRSEATMRQASRLLTSLNLPGNQPGQFVVQDNLSTQQIMNLIQDLLHVCEETLREIQVAAEELESEREKWWKFW